MLSFSQPDIICGLSNGTIASALELTLRSLLLFETLSPISRESWQEPTNIARHVVRLW